MRNTGPSQRVRQMVIDRDNRLCRRCGGAGQDIQHRRPRGSGGTSLDWVNGPANLITVCRPCHTHIESHRDESYRTGWLIRYAEPDMPYQIPLTDLSGTTFALTDEGDVITILGGTQ